MKARKIITSVLAASVVALLGVSQAQAVDGKLYPGSMCVRNVGSTAVLPTLSVGRLLNPGATILQLDCPVVHDSIAASVQSGYVDVMDRNFSSDTAANENVQICAQLHSYSQFNSNEITHKFSSKQCTTGADSVSKRLSFSGISANSNAHYFYRVTLPPTFNGLQSAIISYQVTENE